MTILSPSRRLAFVHIQKCGGSSVEIAFARRQRWDDLVLGSTKLGEAIAPHYKQALGLYKHNTALELREIVGAELWSDWTSVALVRRPDKIYQSYYKWTHATIERHLAANKTTRQELLDELDRPRQTPSWRALSWGHFQESLRARDFSDYARRLMARKAYARLSRYVCDKQGERIVDRVYKLEELERFEQEFGQLIGEPDFRMPHENKGKSLPASALRWEPDTLAEFTALHAEEYERFGYEPPVPS